MQRFRAWWEGYELETEIRESFRAAPRDADADADDAEAGEASASNWPTEPLAIAQAMWGEGFTAPGGPDYIESLVAGLGLSSQTSTLELGSGIGGGARAIAAHYGAYVTAWDLDPEKAAMGTHQAKVYDLEGKASVNVLDPTKLEFRTDFYQGAFIREMLYTIEDKKGLLGAVSAAVKNGTEVIVTDLIAPDPNAAAVWAAAEGEPVFLWDQSAAMNAMAEVGIKIRSAEDETDAYIAMILRALGGLVDRMARERPPREVLLPTVTEVERWGRRVSAMEAGKLRYFQFNTLKT